MRFELAMIAFIPACGPLRTNGGFRPEARPEAPGDL